MNRTLAARLRERIEREGPISFHDWMHAALYDENEGYYCRTDVTRWGRKGDYRTSAERSPLFAATFARYFATLHQELDTPHRWTIIEAGTGAGHFARGVLETLRLDFPQAFESLTYIVDETSDDARSRAFALLDEFTGRVEFRRLDEFEVAPDTCIVFSNELLDAFPVHRITMRGGELLELCIGTNDAGEFVWTTREPTTRLLADYLRRAGIELIEGQIAEVNLAAEEWIRKAAAVIGRGYVVTVDYGAEAVDLYDASYRPEGTLRAFRGHRLVEDVLAHPGEQDITMTVDWSAVRRAGEESGLQTVLLMRQDEFMLHAGALEQLERMTARARDEAETIVLRVGAREMILPGGMSGSFQVLVQKKT